MAFAGMKHVVAAPIKTEVAGQAVTYDTGVEIGAAISATVTINRNTEGLYANDALKESDNSITGGTIDLNIDDISDDAAEKILGVKKTAGESQTPTVFHETGEAAPYVGLGYYRVRRLNGVESYRAYWYHKTQLSMANETANTKAGSITWQTPTLNGNIMAVSTIPPAKASSGITPILRKSLRRSRGWTPRPTWRGLKNGRAENESGGARAALRL